MTKGIRGFQKGHKNFLSEESGKKISKSLKGKIPWNKGLKGIKTNNKGQRAWNKGISMSENSKKKLSNSLKGRVSPMKGRKFLQEHKDKLSKSHKGIPNYKNRKELGTHITPLTKIIRTCMEYLQWRSQVYERDNWTCQTCYIRGGKLEAHHIKEFSKIIKENNIKTYEQSLKCKELWDINNGVTLCKDCHNLTKKGRNKNDKK